MGWYAVKKDGKYRYSLQFDAITDEQIQVGELLEKLGNRKSAIIVPALYEYIKRHPEITEDHAKIKVQVEPSIKRAELEKMVLSILERKLPEMQLSYNQERPESLPIIADSDIDEMLQNLDLFNE